VNEEALAYWGLMRQKKEKVYGLVGRISHNELSLRGHELFKIGIVCVFM
jgi:hypothetical protein